MTMAEATDPTSVTLTFEDFYILTTGDVDAFAVDWNEQATPPPYHVTVEGKRFAYTGITFLVKGHGAELPSWVQAEEAAGHLVLFVERETRLMAYVFDPEAEEDE